ncbi:hypothetical protein KR222_001052 [Zaprionus bogoriensis]|nr:hypothetical protein KR222_001052 [Zaprionus bogoriensis]
MDFRTCGNDLWISVSDTSILQSRSQELPESFPCPAQYTAKMKIVAPTPGTGKLKCPCAIKSHPEIPKIALYDLCVVGKRSKQNPKNDEAQQCKWGIARQAGEGCPKASHMHHWGRNIIQLDQCSYKSDCIWK